MRKILIIFMLFLTACSGIQRPLPPPPNNLTVDAGPLVFVNSDAYTIVLPPVPDVALRLNISDGRTDSGEIISPLRTGQVAPIKGVLFNGPAVARIVVEFRGQAAQCRIDSQADLDRMAVMARRDIALLNLSLNSQRQAYTLMLASRDRDLTRLYTYIQQNNNPRVDPWPLVGVGLGGLVLGAGIMTAILLLNH